MGTLNRAVNLFRGLFKNPKRTTSNQHTGHPGEPSFGEPAMMNRKKRTKTDQHTRQYHGRKAKQFHTFGGGLGWNEQAIYLPPRRKSKGYIKDAQMGSTFNKKKRGLKKAS